MEVPYISPASKPYELNALQKYAVDALDDEVPEIYNYVRNKDAIREIFEKYVFRDAPNKNLMSDINTILKRLDKEIVPPNLMLANRFIRLHELFTKPDPRLFTNETDVEKLRLVLVACFESTVNTLEEPKLQKNPLPEKDKEPEKVVKPAFQPLAQAQLVKRKHLSKEECENVYYHHINDLVAQLAEIDFAKFLSDVPTISKHLMAINMRAKIKCGDLDGAIREFLTLLVTLRCWGQFIDALDKYPELEKTRALFS